MYEGESYRKKDEQDSINIYKLLEQDIQNQINQDFQEFDQKDLDECEMEIDLLTEQLNIPRNDSDLSNDLIDSNIEFEMLPAKIDSIISQEEIDKIVQIKEKGMINELVPERETITKELEIASNISIHQEDQQQIIAEEGLNISSSDELKIHSFDDQYVTTSCDDGEVKEIVIEEVVVEEIVYHHSDEPLIAVVENVEETKMEKSSSTSTISATELNTKSPPPSPASIELTQQDSSSTLFASQDSEKTLEPLADDLENDADTEEDVVIPPSPNQVLNTIIPMSTAVIIMNVSFIALFVVLGVLWFVSGNIHVAVLLSVGVALFAGIQWFLTQVEYENRKKFKKID